MKMNPNASHLTSWMIITITATATILVSQHSEALLSPIPMPMPMRHLYPSSTFDCHNKHTHNHYHENVGSRSASAIASTRSALHMAKRSSEQIMSKPWLPENIFDDDIFAVDEERLMLERKSIQYLASLVQYQLKQRRNGSGSGTGSGSGSNCTDRNEDDEQDDRKPQQQPPTKAMELASDRFRDLACTYEGEMVLEKLFDTRDINVDVAAEVPSLEDLERDPDVIRGAIIAMQSFLMLGMQVGVKGRPEQKERSVAHLRNSGKNYSSSSNNNNNSNSKQPSRLDIMWETYNSRSLKHKSDITAGTQLLAELKRKRSAQSAFDVLVSLGAWTKHEDVALLRSGFPIRFTAEEEEDAMSRIQSSSSSSTSSLNQNRDPDSILGLRKDLRHLKAFTIDSEYTDDIDDALSIENVMKEDGTEGKRIWIHIADADRWAPRDSKIFQSAQLRATSVYLPQGSVPMFPACLSGGTMALRADTDSCALSLGVELNDDGSIDESTLIITPSIIHVNYRLAYDEVDEMLECGVAYFEEWELGALLAEASKRRKYRISCGSTEGFVPAPIPQAEVRVIKKDIDGIDPDGDDDDDDVDILLNVEVTHNSGMNQSEAVLDMNSSMDDDFAPPVSSAFLLVTEMMIMSGEAMGKLKHVLESLVEKQHNEKSHLPILENKLDLPFRTQPKPDFGKRYQELQTLESLKSKKYCHAWYARRFFEPVRVMEDPLPHHGLGLDCYVQWTSPIRRFSDLQVHASVKRFLRKNQVNKMMEAGLPIPESLTASDLGCEIPRQVESSKSESGSYKIYVVDHTKNNGRNSGYDINYKKGLGFVNAARMVQKKSKEYWLFEYVRREVEKSDFEIEYETTVLACVNPQRGQYAIFVHELGLEHRYLSEKGDLQIGEKLFLKVANVSPRLGILTFTLSSRYGGKSTKFAPAA